MQKSIGVWLAAVLPGWCRAYPRAARQHLVLGIGALVLGCIIVGYGVGWAQQRALYPGDARALWRTVQATAEVPRIQGPLTIFTAASLTDAFREMGTTIEQANLGTKAIFNFAGSPAPRINTLPSLNRTVYKGVITSRSFPFL